MMRNKGVLTDKAVIPFELLSSDRMNKLLSHDWMNVVHSFHENHVNISGALVP
jgi:hypothetical protein